MPTRTRQAPLAADFHFADDPSRKSALQAFRLLYEPAKAPALYVVTGPACSGKTRLVETLVRKAFPGTIDGAAAWRHFRSISEPVKHALLGDAAVRGFLHLQAEPAENFADPSLAAFVTSPGWSWREPRTARLLTALNRCAVFLVGVDLALPADLARRARFIALTAV